MSIRSFIRWLICLLVITSQAAAGERAWRMVNTPHYQLLSQLDDRDTAEWMRGFDQFILSTSDILHMDLRALPPLTVVIFARDKDYMPYKLVRPNGKTANVAGQFVREPTWSMIGMAHDVDNEGFHRTIQHEATHWLMSADQARHPAWFSEGIAEMFSTFERHIDKVNWAKPISSHLGLLRSGSTEPLAQFLIEPSAIFDRDDHTDRFYAQAWAFTSFLMISKDPGRRQLLLKFLETYRTKSGEATVEAVFGSSLNEIERDFHHYIEERSFPYMSQPFKVAPEPPPLQPASAVLVETSLGFLALGSDKQELAQQHADKAIALDPNASGGYEILAYLALRDRDFDKAAIQAEAALKRGSKDSELFMVMGDSYVSGTNAQKPNASKERVNMYESAINLNPRRLAIYQRLTDALFAIDKPREEDAKFLNIGLRIFPGEDWLRVGTAVIDERLGRRGAAMTTLETALQPESTLDGQQRSYATNLRHSWLVEVMNSEIQAAVKKGDFAGAREVVSRYREQMDNNADVVTFMKEVDARLEISELMTRFDEAMRANKKTEARALADQLLARPNLPADMRKYLQQRLR